MPHYTRWAGAALSLGVALLLAASPTAPTESRAYAEALVREVHAAVNGARQAEGLAPLAFDDALADVAAGHSHDMAERGYFSHTSPEGERFDMRIERTGEAYSGLGENLYRGAAYARRLRIRAPEGVTVRYDWRDPASQAADVVQAWLRSPSHRRALLGPGFERHGIGVAPGPDYTWYVTQDLAR